MASYIDRVNDATNSIPAAAQHVSLESFLAQFEEVQPADNIMSEIESEVNTMRPNHSIVSAVISGNNSNADARLSVIPTVCKCKFCEKEYPIDQLHQIHIDRNDRYASYYISRDNYICDSCFDNGSHEDEVEICSCCGEYYWHSATRWCEDEHSIVCIDCARGGVDGHIMCYECGKVIGNNGNLFSFWRGTILCEDCANGSYFVMCDNCGRYVDESDFNMCHIETDADNCVKSCECPECTLRHSMTPGYHNATINGYHSYNRSFKLIGTPNEINGVDRTMYFGAEVELDCGNNNGDKEGLIADITEMNPDNMYFIATRDDSVNGPECVFDAYDRDSIRKAEIFQRLFHCAIVHEYNNSLDKAGGHIHVSRAALGNTEEEIRDTIAKIGYVMTANFAEIAFMANRKKFEYCEPLSNDVLTCDNIEDIYHIMERASRYVCFNIKTCKPTVEFRIFNGTCDYNRFLGNVDFCYVLIHRCMELSLEQLREMSIFDILACDKNEYPELNERLLELEVYIEEDIANEVEYANQYE